MCNAKDTLFSREILIFGRQQPHALQTSLGRAVLITRCLQDSGYPRILIHSLPGSFNSKRANPIRPSLQRRRDDAKGGSTVVGDSPIRLSINACDLLTNIPSSRLLSNLTR